MDIKGGDINRGLRPAMPIRTLTVKPMSEPIALISKGCEIVH
jgi:hypothetical protein